MKGMVFTEFLEMVEAKFSADMVDDIIDDANPASAVHIRQSGPIRMRSWWIWWLRCRTEPKFQFLF